jgi:HEAT repeat protein
MLQKKVLVGLTCLVSAGCIVSTGCSGKRWNKMPILVTQGDAEEYIETAKHATLADDRRDALTQLARSRHTTRHDVMQCCAVIARDDKSPSVRIAAVRLMASCGHLKAPDWIFGAIEWSSDARFERVRKEGYESLHKMMVCGNVPRDSVEPVMVGALFGLSSDPSRDVRIACARLLGECPSRASLDGLISALSDSDFGVVYHAETSLRRLTGRHFGRGADQWREWLATTDRPFEHAKKVGEDDRSWWTRVFSLSL